MGKSEKIKAPASEKQVLSLLSLCARQGAAKSGEFLTEQTIKEHKAVLVIVASDASDNTKKNFRDSCDFYTVPFRIFGTKESVGHAIGRETRASLALTNAGLSQKILSLIDELQSGASLAK